MRIFITGGCGFIGSNLAEYHLAKGDEVYVIDDLSAGSLKNIEGFQSDARFAFEKADLLIWKKLEEALSWAERVYHMAAIIGIFQVLAKPVKVLTNNIQGCERILNIANRFSHSPRIILASSSSVYGYSKKTVVSEKDNLILPPLTHPLFGYAVSKIVNEALSMASYKKFQVPFTAVRLFNTIGPRQTGQYGMVVPRLVKQACQGKPMTVFGDGTQSRSFSDVRDVVLAIDQLAENENSIGEIVNVGNDSEITINNLAELIRKRAKSSSIIEYIPYAQAYGIDMSDVKRRRPDLNKLIQLTGFQPKWTLEQTVDDLIHYCAS